MSVYEFVCRDCDKTFRVTQPISQYDPKKVHCPKCNGKHIERVWSSVFVETSKKS
jgi:putative FmdB family regulatory protein